MAIKHESKMTNEELLYIYEWAINIGFLYLAKTFLKELKKRGLVKNEKRIDGLCAFN